MQELILIISRCLGHRKNIKGSKHYWRFHFKGFYKGQKVKCVHLYSLDGLNNGVDKMQSLSKGDDYLLWVQKKRLNCEILEVELIKYKKII